MSSSVINVIRSAKKGHVGGNFFKTFICHKISVSDDIVMDILALKNISGIIQVLAIEFVTFAIEFVTLAIEFVPLAIEFVTLAIEFVTLAIEFVALARKFVITELTE